MPLFVMDTLGDYHGLPGLFVSGIFSACLSSVSPTLNSLSAVTIEDYIKPLYKYVKKEPLTGSKAALISKALCLCYGGVCIGIAFIGRFASKLYVRNFYKKKTILT